MVKINRKSTIYIEKLLNYFPVVGILGARQVGKTTLAKELAPGLKKEVSYIDLESTADLIKITAAKQLKKRLTPVVLRKIRQTIGIFFIIFGVILATKKYIPQETIQIFDKVIEKVK